jgi:hypothetical protein
MKLYSILLFLFIFGLVSSGINESGLFSVDIPATESGFEEANVQELTEGVANTGLNPITGFTIILTFFRVFASAVLAIITIIPILSSWGVPIWLGAMVQAPIWLVEVAGFYQLATGHNMLGME